MMTREEALDSVGKYGKVDNGYQFNTGQVVEVHSTGEFVKFARGGRMTPRWFSRKDVTLHECGRTPDVESQPNGLTIIEPGRTPDHERNK
jgi:hypothetical protein